MGPPSRHRGHLCCAMRAVCCSDCPVTALRHSLLGLLLIIGNRGSFVSYEPRLHALYNNIGLYPRPARSKQSSSATNSDDFEHASPSQVLEFGAQRIPVLWSQPCDDVTNCSTPELRLDQFTDGDSSDLCESTSTDSASELQLVQGIDSPSEAVHESSERPCDSELHERPFGDASMGSDSQDDASD